MLVVSEPGEEGEYCEQQQDAARQDIKQVPCAEQNAQGGLKGFAVGGLAVHGARLWLALQAGDGLRNDGGTRVVRVARVQLLQQWQGFVHCAGFGQR